MTRRTQGHPARTNRDELHQEIEKLATRLVHLVPKVIRSPKFDPNDVTYAKASAIGILHLLSVAEGKPSPYEIYEWNDKK